MTSKQAIEVIKQVLGFKSESFFEAKTDQGMPIKIDGDLEVGKKVYISTEEGMIPAPPGVHMLDDGSQIEVDDDGIISKIKMGEMEETEDEIKEDEDEKAAIADESMSEVEMEFGDVKLVDGTVLRMEGEGEIVGRRLAKVGYDGTLSAIADGQYETVGGQMLQIVGGAIVGVQSKADDAKRKTGFVEAKTTDGAVLESKTYDVGEEVYVVKDGEMTPAPDGEHQVVLKDSEGNDVKIRVITKDGKITQRENVEEMSSDMEVIANLFAEAIKRFETKLDAVVSKQETLEGKFQKFSKEPAGSRVYTQKTINEESPLTNSKFEGFKRLRERMIQN
jgi:hypothetical protein